jgi:hypothetical protein
MVSLQQLKQILILMFAYLIYSMSLEKTDDISHFVPWNSYEAPTNMKPQEWQQLNDKFSTLIQTVNSTNFAVGYQLNNMVEALKTVLNNVGVGNYIILSVGNSTPLSLTDVVVQDVSTLAVTRFSRIDFIVESMNPFIISKVIITPDKQYISSQNVLPKDPLKPNVFRIENCLHQFSPYATSDDAMTLTNVDLNMFQQTMAEKANELVNAQTTNAVPAGSVAQLPAMSLPPAESLDKGIVGAGPLHPIGL